MKTPRCFPDEQNQNRKTLSAPPPAPWGGRRLRPHGLTIAKLVLHYADNSSQELAIKNGVHVRDWWGDPKQTVTGTNSALAWTGTNPALKKYGGPRPGSLRIYQTTFENPQPGIEITTIDYVSAMENSSPFMIGLTLE